MTELVSHDVVERAARAAFGTGARLVAVEPLAGDASSRRYLRLRLAATGAPATAVAMVLGEGRFSPGSDELGGGEVDELPFVNVARYLAAHGLPVPAIYLDAAGSDGLLLLEDLGDVSLWTAAAGPPPRPVLFEAAVDLLVQLQMVGARHPDPSCYAFRRRFDGRLARRELEHFVEHGIETRHGRPLPVAERAAILAALDPIARPFETPEVALTHRDFMAWNLHVQGERLRLFDFQDALLAPDTYDLAALLTDRTTTAVITPAWTEMLLTRFCDARAAAGAPAPGGIDGVRERYRLCALHRALKVIGRFYFLERVKGKPGYLAYLPAVYGVARGLFGDLPALTPLQRRLAVHVPELGA